MEDDGPNESKGKFRISINDIFTADIDQFYFLIAKESQRSFYILNGMKSHSATFSRLEKNPIQFIKFQKNYTIFFNIIGILVKQKAEYLKVSNK